MGVAKTIFIFSYDAANFMDKYFILFMFFIFLYFIYILLNFMGK